MYLDALSASLSRLCDEKRLSYEAASERCRCSSRYFGSIIRRKSSPTVTVLEGLCQGFEKTPNELLQVAHSEESLSYRVAMQVCAVQAFRNNNLTVGYPVCPRCKIPMEYSYQRFCDRCGQRLSWKRYCKAEVIWTGRDSGK